MWDRGIPPEGQNFGSGTGLAESLTRGWNSPIPHPHIRKDFFSHIPNRYKIAHEDRNISGLHCT
jgi:hypothetical protein